jgi:hypothetical protein
MEPKMKFFISYSHEDKNTAYEIQKVCDQIGISCFLDEKDISWGDSITKSVKQGLHSCTHLVVVLSPDSLKSQWVPYEVGCATERGMTILPFLIDQSIDPPGFLGDALRICSIDELRKHVDIFSLRIHGLAEELKQKLTRIPMAIQNLPIGDTAKNALSQSVNVILCEYQENLDQLEKGRLEIRGPEMDTVFGYFVAAVQTSFRALSRDDLDYWASPESEQYLAHNQELLNRGCTVERIFLLPRKLRPTRSHQEALCRQVQMGISVRIAHLESCQKGIVEDDRELDFGLFDSFAVSFWRFSVGRVFKIRTSNADYRHYSEIYERVTNVCVNVPGKQEQGRVRSMFNNEKQLIDWFRSDQHGA